MSKENGLLAAVFAIGTLLSAELLWQIVKRRKSFSKTT